jgi:hypothetical protein
MQGVKFEVRGKLVMNNDIVIAWSRFASGATPGEIVSTALHNVIAQHAGEVKLAWITNMPELINPIVGNLPASVVDRLRLSLEQQIATVGNLRSWFDDNPLPLTGSATYHVLRYFTYQAIMHWSLGTTYNYDDRNYDDRNYVANELADHYSVLYWTQQHDTLPTT